MDKKPSSSIENFCSFLITREAVIFVADFTIHLLRSLVHLYCAKLSFMCTLPFKRLAIAPLHNFQVRVLLTELYPDHGSVLGAAACRSNEPLCIDDYLICLQKIGFDDPEDGQIDELNFLFQANHLPISVFQPTAQNHDRDSGICPNFPIPTTSTNISGVDSEPVEVDLTPNIVVSAKPEQDDLLLTPLQANSGLDFNFDSADFTSRQISMSKKVVEPLENTHSSTNCSDDASPQYFAFTPPSENSATPPLRQNSESHHVPIPYNAQGTPMSPRVPVFVGPLTGPSSLPTLNNSGIIKSFSDVPWSFQTRDRLHFSRGHLYQLKNREQRCLTETETFVWPRYDKPRHLCVTGLRESDSSEDLGHSSDSESHRRFYQAPCWREKSHDEEDLDEEVEGSEGEEDEPERFGRREEEDKVIRFSEIMTSPSTFGSIPRFSHCDRNIRDVNILRRLSVPFSYEEVAYSSNEYFREIKSKPGLTCDQITAMLDARRRATNRQAAERCRRVKSAARDSLANQLDRLRLEHAELARRIIRTRRRRQQKWDELSSAKKHLLQNLVDSSGTPLDPAQWRIQTTNEGELILMRIDANRNVNNQTSDEDGRNDVYGR